MDSFLFDMGEKGTKLQVTASEEISKTSSHVKYFWLLFIPIPVGSYNTTTTVETGVINSGIRYCYIQGRPLRRSVILTGASHMKRIRAA